MAAKLNPNLNDELADVVEEIRITNSHLAFLNDILFEKCSTELDTIADCMRNYINAQHLVYEKLLQLTAGGK